MAISKEVKVGLLTFVAGVILYLGFNFLKGIDFFSSSKSYYAVYDDIAGLDVSNAVILNGFVVGRINEINFVSANDTRLLVEFHVRKDILLNDSTIALIGGEILENKSIQLIIGRGTRTLQEGDSAISEVQKGLTEILQERALPLIDNFNEITVRINNILESFKGNSARINKSLENIQRLSNDLANTTGRGDLDKTLANFKELSDGLNDKQNGITPLLARANVLVDSLNHLELSRTLSKLEKTMVNMQQITESLNSGQGTLGKLIKSDSLHNELNIMLKRLDTLLKHIDENPKHFFGPLGQSRKKIQRDLEKQAKSN